jgi:hypothetical protein
MTQEWGWHGFFIVLGLCGFISVLLLIPLWNVKSNPKYIPDGPTKAEELSKKSTEASA